MSFIGRIGRAIGGGVKGFVRGGVLGAVSGAARGAFGGGGARTLPALPPPSNLPSVFSLGAVAPAFAPRGRQGPNVPVGTRGAVPEPGPRGAIQRFLPGGQSGYAAAPPGYHVNKAYLRFLRAQEQGRPGQDPFSASRAVNLIVRNRKLNPLNPRALRRANARQVGAVRLMRRVLRGSGYSISRSGFGRKKKGRR